MEFKTIISADDLVFRKGDRKWVVVDCRPGGRGAESPYLAGHVPGAVHADLEDDLSGKIIPGVTGRHPLPGLDEFVGTLGAWGIDSETQVVVYDDTGNSNAVRLWWMLRWLGHDRVAVLDGGLKAWIHSAGVISTKPEIPAPAEFTPKVRVEMLVDISEVDRIRSDPVHKLVDSRSGIRYRGEEERLDPVAGHIPGAISIPFEENLTEDGFFKDAGALAERFKGPIGDVRADHVVFYCGSGVTAAHNILAFVHAGFDEPKLFVGSWSEWITDSARPVATGE